MHTQPIPHIDRRSFLSTLGKGALASGLGLTAYEALRQPEVRAFFANQAGQIATAAATANENLPNVTTPRVPASPPHIPIPLENQDEYGAFLKTLSLRYISPAEIFAAHRRSRNGISNALPPKHLWARMAPTLELADELRHRLGVKLSYIASAYRSPDYNKQCPGAAKYSQHIQNRALDLVYECSPKDAFNEARKMRNEGKFRGGLGLYSSFIHLDTRGRNATWGA